MTESDGLVPILRPAARTLLIDEQDRALLFRSVVDEQELSNIWITPGGALKPGETHEQAALREMWEETGLTGMELGPWVWTRRHTWRWGDRLYDSLERFFLVRVRHFDVAPGALEPIEVASLREHRWWAVSDIRAASLHETFVPRKLGELLPPLIAGDIPPQAIDIAGG